MGNPLLGLLADPFTGLALNTTVWNNTTPGGVVSIVAPGRVGVQVNAAYYMLGAGTYDATGQTVYARVTPATAGTGGKGVETILQLWANATNKAQIVCNPGSYFQFQTVTAGTTSTVTLPAYDPAGHAWWRIRETGGSFAMDASADGYAWTQLATLTYGWSPAAVTLNFLAGTFDGTTGGSACIEHINTMVRADGKLPSWPRIRFQVAWNQGANTAGQPAFVDLSSRLRGSWSAELAGRQYELDQIQSGQMTVTLDNLDGALNPLNTSSPYAPNVLPMRRCRLQAVWPPTRNLMDYGVANGASVANIGWNFGSIAPAPVAGTPTGHTSATSWTFAAHTANTAFLFQGLSSELDYNVADEECISLPGGGGGTWSSSVWVSSVAGTASGITAVVQISWYDVTGALISTSLGSNITIPAPGSWTQATVTAPAPPAAVACRPGFLITSTTTASSTVLLTAWQTENGAAPTPWTSPGIANGLWSGFVERWPQKWALSGTYGQVEITCVDALASLADFTLQTNFAASLLALNPTFTYPFNEPTGATAFADAAGHRPARTIGVSALGSAGSITAGNSVTGTGSVGSAGPVVTITNPTTGSSTSSKGQYLTNTSTLQVPPPTGAWTRVIAFRTTVTPTNPAYCAIWAAISVGSPVSQGFVILGVNSSGHGFGWVNSTDGSAASNLAVPDVVVNDGNWHVIAAQLSADGKTWTVTVDSHSYQTTTSGDYHPTGLIADCIGAVAATSLKVFQFAFSGDVAFATQFPTAIGGTTAADLATGFATGWAGETSAARAQRILTMAGYQGPLSTLDATTAMGGANLDGIDAMSALQLVGDSEAGQVYLDGAGTVWLASRQWRYLQNSPAVSFGENPGEIPYLNDVEIDYDDTHIYNDVQVTNQPLPGAAQQPPAHTLDATSQAQYLPRTLQRTINVQDPTVPQAAAQFLVSQYAQPLPRVATMTVDVGANPAVMAQALALTFGSRAQVARRPFNAPAITVQQFVEKLTWDGDDQGHLHLSAQMNSATPYLGWGVVASLHTTVRTASTAGAATVTLNPLTGSAANPAAAVLPAGTTLTLGYGTAAAETLTVQSVAATSPGYASVAVTFTAATAHNHAVGELVCQPIPAGLTLPATVQAGYPQSLDAAATLSATTPRVPY